ncbi:hypothetical protein L195_g022365 [Trifolium pratense]|uniref:Uncharacterized protein n=1 Tax=Trifolium pratense TaxID=57577 RepID=A0A2K3N7S6_TRIPR|nr:hypothetical protein L195_g022365 [Trifolium pratense]
MPPQSELDGRSIYRPFKFPRPLSEPENTIPFLRHLAGKLTSLSKIKIYFLSYEELTSLVEYELSRLTDDEFYRLMEAEIFPFLPIVLQAFFSLIYHFARKAKQHKEQQQTTRPVTTFDRIHFFIFASLSTFIVTRLTPSLVRDFCQWLDTIMQTLKGDVAVTTIALQPGGLIPSNSPIFFSKYSIPEGVQGLKGIRYLRKAKTVFRQGLKGIRYHRKAKTVFRQSYLFAILFSEQPSQVSPLDTSRFHCGLSKKIALF